MRAHLVNGVEYLCPRYVVRVPGGWQVRVPNVPTLFFADSKHDGVTGSHDAAVDWRVQKLPMPDGIELARYATKERADKKERVGIPGVFLCKKEKRGKRAPQYELLVSVNGQPTRTIYVGTANTWQGRLPEKLKLAGQIREEKLQKQALKLAQSF